MSFPETNKIKQEEKSVESSTLENAKLLEQMVNKVDWKVLAKAWALGLIMLCITLFAIIVTIKLALII